MKKGILTIWKNFLDTDISGLAVNLTYVSLFAIFPFIALIIGLSKGFGIDVILVNKLNDIIISNNIGINIVKIAENLVESLNSSLLSGLGIVVIIWSVVNLLMLLEKSFNEIWNVKNNREIGRRILSYIAIIFLIPIFAVLFIGTSSKILSFIQQISAIGNFTLISVEILKLLVSFTIFMVIYYFIPNTNVSFKSSFISSLLVVLSLWILSMFYQLLQSSISKYNTIYGSLAFVPLFLIWVKYIWIIILIGARLSYIIDTNYDSDDIKLPIKYRKEVSLYLLYLINERFLENKKPYNIDELYEVTGIKKYVIRICLDILYNLSFITKTHNQDDIITYQVNKNPEYISIDDYINSFENEGLEYKFDIFEIEEKKEKYNKFIFILSNNKLIKDMGDNL
ncbi:YihY/virulence factor BrkB family protein [Caviibacter abscessus]|uniref:YihY/virulence factor BrkB family protein n=1 Tax=Caviibacter abscessus TaxID=1766719 RepID=UPI0008366CF9|nr:YihY/virulence factor BrkB family protein [Caviibacter abscessus]